MSDHVTNPLAFAMEEFNVAINAHGDFSYVRFDRDLESLRLRLQEGGAATLARRLVDLDGDVTSLFAHAPSDALILVREAHLCDVDDCDFELGDVSVSARTHDGLLSALALLEFDLEDPDAFLGSIHPQ